MKKNETGEFELVVGDRQLLSAFFIVVLLCAVAFAMGYVVGQSGPKPKGTATEAQAASPSTTPATETRPQALPPAPTQQAAAQPTPDPNAPPADSTPQPTTQPAQTPADQKPSTPAAAAPPPPAPSDNGLVSPENLPAGSFWQAIAVPQPQAEVMRTTLRDSGFTVYLTPGPRNLTRVLVGPYADTAQMGQAKTLLEKAGMHPVKYKP